MSLINKMLQDLDARGSAPEQPGSAVRPSPMRERALPLRAAAIVACFLVLLILAAVLGWRHFAPAPKLKPLATMPASLPKLAPPAAVVAAPPPLPAMTPVAVAPAAPATPTADAPAPPRVRQTSAQAASRTHQEARKAISVEAAPASRINAAVATPAPPPRAENEYRRALDALQEGRLGEALAGLQQTLLIDPHHQAARETLVRLLLEANRLDEAMRELDQGLLLDPKQPTQAMLLARLQLEKGGPAIDTLLRTLPYASENGDYQAFLAGVLQRAQRNGESAEHYQLALRKAPQNGVWWMGLGIALQADKRLPEAREAFEHAKAANLSPELLTFVERKLAQLSQPVQAAH
jgi:MSHA biogenesis protein MshN